MQETKVSFVCSASAFQNNHQSFAVVCDVLQDDEQDTKQAQSKEQRLQGYGLRVVLGEAPRRRGSRRQ